MTILIVLNLLATLQPPAAMPFVVWNVYIFCHGIKYILMIRPYCP